MKYFLSIIAFLFLTISGFSQVGIGTTDPKANLDISASSSAAPVATDGLLIPRVTAFPTLVTVAQNGMMVFLTTAFGSNQVGLYYYDFPSTTWKWMATGNNTDVWTNNNVNTRIEISKLSDGVTARPAGNEVVVTDAGNFGIGTNVPTKSLVLNQKTTTDGFQFTGQSIFGTSSGTGFLMALGQNVLGNKQLWLGDADSAGVFASTFSRYVSGGTTALLDAVSGDGSIRRRMSLGVPADTNSGLILANSFVNGGFGIGALAGAAALSGTLSNGSLSVDGKIGVGNIAPISRVDISGDANVTAGYFYGGTSSPANLEIIRTMPIVVNNTVEIGNFNITHGSHNFRLTSTVSLNQFSVAKSYIVSASYNQTNNVWQLLLPISTTGIFVADDFEIDINANNGLTSLRVRRKSGIVPGNISIRIESIGTINDVFTPTSATSAVTAPTVIFGSNLAQNGWSTTGNSATVDGTNFIGTTDGVPLNFRVGNSKAGRISTSAETFFGFEAGKNNTNSANDRNNSAFGYRAFSNNSATTARDNTAIGQTALSFNNGGSFNTALGSGSLTNNVSGGQNTAIGKDALNANTASFNTAIGWESLVYNTTGTRNIGLGIRPLRYYATASDNIAIGYEALVGSNTSATNTGTNNTIIGNFSMTANTSGIENVTLGNDAMRANTSGSQNTALGFQSLSANNSGIENTAVGRKAMNSNSTGGQNTAIGFNSLIFNAASNNTAVGRNSSYSNLAGTNNATLGFNTMFTNTAGAGNTAVGASTMYFTTGSNNVAIGNQTGYNLTSGSNNIMLGANIDVPTPAGSDQMNIGNLIYGATMTSTAAGKIGIGVTVPTTRLQVGPDHTIPNVGGLVQVNLNDADTQTQGLKVSVKKTTGTIYAVNGTAFGTGATTNVGLYGYALNATGKNWGLFLEEGDAYVKGVTAIGTTTPSASAALEISSTTKGVLLPRMTKVQRDLIVKVAGLMIYQTDGTPGLRVCNGTNWIRYTETID